VDAEAWQPLSANGASYTSGGCSSSFIPALTNPSFWAQWLAYFARRGVEEPRNILPHRGCWPLFNQNACLFAPAVVGEKVQSVSATEKLSGFFDCAARKVRELLRSEW